MNRKQLFGMGSILGILCIVVIIYFVTQNYITTIPKYSSIEISRNLGKASKDVNQEIETTTIQPPLITPECPDAKTSSMFELKNVRVESMELLGVLQNCDHLEIIRLLEVEVIGSFNGKKAILPKLTEFTWDHITSDPRKKDMTYYHNLNSEQLLSEFLFFDTVNRTEPGSITFTGQLQLRKLHFKSGIVTLHLFRDQGEVKITHFRNAANSILAHLYSDANFKLKNLTLESIPVNVDLLRVTDLKFLRLNDVDLSSEKSSTMSTFIQSCLFLEELYLNTWMSMKPDFNVLETRDLISLNHLSRVSFTQGVSLNGINIIRFKVSPGLSLPQVEYFSLDVTFGKMIDPNLTKHFAAVFPNLKKFWYEAVDFKMYNEYRPGEIPLERFQSLYDKVIYAALEIGSLQSIYVIGYMADPTPEMKAKSHKVSTVLKEAGIRSEETNFVLSKNENQKWYGRALVGLVKNMWKPVYDGFVY